MDRRTGTYVYGSEARSWEAQPLRRREEEIRRRERQQQRRRPAPKRKTDKLAVFFICITFAAAMEKENATSITQLENSVNLDEIYASATGKLGMKAAKKGRVFTYKSRKSTQVRQHGKIPVK